MKTIFLLMLFSPLLYASSFAGGGGGITCSTDGTFVGKQAGTMGCYTPAGGGNVTGPGSSTAHNLTAYADTSGTVLEDAGIATTAVCTLTGSQTLTNKILTSPSFGTQTTYSYATATTVPYLDASKHLVSSAVTPTTLAFLDATSSVQTQIDAKAPAASPTITTSATFSYATASKVAVFDGSKNLVSSTVASADLFGNPMTASGDIIYGGASGVPTRLAKGSDTQVLTLASGVPTWAAAGGGGSYLPLTGGTVTGTITNTKGSDTTLTGTSVATSGTTVTGVGTHFLTEAHVNDIFTFPTCDTAANAITAIASDISMTLSHAHSTCPATASQAKVSPSILVSTSTGGTPLWYIDAGGALRHGTSGTGAYAVASPETTISRIMGDTSSNRQVIIQGTEQAYDYEGFSMGGSSSGWLSKMCGGGKCAQITASGLVVNTLIASTTKVETPATTIAVNWALSNYRYVDTSTAGGAVTFTFSGQSDGSGITILLKESSGNSITFPAAVKWASADGAFAYTNTTGAYDKVHCDYINAITTCEYKLNYL